MHELAMIEGILEIAAQQAAKHNCARINAIKLQVGEFTGVVKEALEFSFEVAKRGTLADTATLEVEEIKLRQRCPACREIFEAKDRFDFLCPVCNMPAEIVSGRELQIEWIDLE